MELKESSPLGLGLNEWNLEFTVASVYHKGWLNSVAFDRHDPSPSKRYWIKTFPNEYAECWDCGRHTLSDLVTVGEMWLLKNVLLYDEALRKGEDAVHELTRLLCTTMKAYIVHGWHNEPWRDYLGVATELLHCGANPTRVLETGETPYCYARSRGDLFTFCELFDAHPRVFTKQQRRTCWNCAGEGSLLAPAFQRCAGCEARQYCSVACQKMAWRLHRSECRPCFDRLETARVQTYEAFPISEQRKSSIQSMREAIRAKTKQHADHDRNFGEAQAANPAPAGAIIKVAKVGQVLHLLHI